MKKTLLFLLSLAFAAIALLNGAGCSDMSGNGREIDKVLSKTKEILRSLPPSEENKSGARKEYRDWLGYATRQMRTIDTSHCPQDFRYAYERYIRAWEDVTLAKRKYNGEEGIFTQIYSQMIPNGSGIATAYSQLNTAIDDINTVSARYGARIRLAHPF